MANRIRHFELVPDYSCNAPARMGDLIPYGVTTYGGVMLNAGKAFFNQCKAFAPHLLVHFVITHDVNGTPTHLVYLRNNIIPNSLCESAYRNAVHDAEMKEAGLR